MYPLTFLTQRSTACPHCSHPFPLVHKAAFHAADGGHFERLRNIKGARAEGQRCLGHAFERQGRDASGLAMMGLTAAAFVKKGSSAPGAPSSRAMYGSALSASFASASASPCKSQTSRAPGLSFPGGKVNRLTFIVRSPRAIRH